jgi:hypothetical protein
MRPEIVRDSHVAFIDTTSGTSVLPLDTLGLPEPPPSDDDEACLAWVASLSDYLPAECVDPEGAVATRSGYVVRMSAPGYMDATEWEYCETEADIAEWLENEAESAGIGNYPDRDERIAQCCANFGELCKFSHYKHDSPNGVSSVTYDSMRPIREEEAEHMKAEEIWVRVEHAQGSDYSGCSATVANYRELERMRGDHPEHILTGYGSYGTYAIYVRLDCPGDIWELLTGLAQYPCIDDESVSAVEDEWREEAMSELVLDVERELFKRFPCLEDISFPEGTYEGLITDIAQQCDHWHYENSGAYADPRKVADALMVSPAWGDHVNAAFNMLFTTPCPDVGRRVRVITEGGAVVECWRIPWEGDDEPCGWEDLVLAEYGHPSDIIVQSFEA